MDKETETLKKGDRIIWDDPKSKVGRSILGVIKETGINGTYIEWKDGSLGWVYHRDMQSISKI